MLITNKKMELDSIMQEIRNSANCVAIFIQQTEKRREMAKTKINPNIKDSGEVSNTIR
jgi:hypothetical protein